MKGVGGGGGGGEETVAEHLTSGMLHLHDQLTLVPTRQRRKSHYVTTAVCKRNMQQVLKIEHHDSIVYSNHD